MCVFDKSSLRTEEFQNAPLWKHTPLGNKCQRKNFKPEKCQIQLFPEGLTWKGMNALSQFVNSSRLGPVFALFVKVAGTPAATVGLWNKSPLHYELHSLLPNRALNFAVARGRRIFWSPPRSVGMGDWYQGVIQLRAAFELTLIMGCLLSSCLFSKHPGNCYMHWQKAWKSWDRSKQWKRCQLQ